MSINWFRLNCYASIKFVRRKRCCLIGFPFVFCTWFFSAYNNTRLRERENDSVLQVLPIMGIDKMHFPAMSKFISLSLWGSHFFRWLFFCNIDSLYCNFAWLDTSCHVDSASLPHQKDQFLSSWSRIWLVSASQNCYT